MANWRFYTRDDFEESLWDDHNGGGAAKSSICADELVGAKSAAAFINAERAELNLAVRCLKHHIIERPQTHFRRGGSPTIPRAISWRPYGLDYHGTLLAVAVLRNSQAFNLCEVEVFLTVELPQLERLATTRALMLFLLTDAVKSGGSLAIQFTRRCFKGRVPPSVVRLAEQSGVELGYAGQGTISPAEARRLYLNLTPLSCEARAILDELSGRGFFAIERVCYLIHHGIWSALAVDCLLRCSPYAELALGRAVQPEHGALFDHVLAHARQALLAETLERTLRRREHSHPEHSDFVVDLEHAHRDIELAMCGESLACRIPCLETPVVLPNWNVDQSDFSLPEGRETIAFLRGRTLAEMRALLDADIDQAAGSVSPERRGIVILSADFHSLQPPERSRFVRKASECGVDLVVAPRLVSALDEDSAQRLGQGRKVCA